MMGMGKYEGCMRDVKRDVIGKCGVWEVKVKGFSIPLYLSLLLVPFLSPPCSSLPSLRGRKSVQNEKKNFYSRMSK